MTSYRIVIVDDELPNLESLERILKSDGAEVHSFLEPEKAIVHLRKNATDVLLTDLRMNNWSGMDLLESVKHLDPSLEVIMITAYGTVEIAVEAMKKGAYDFITKPLQRVNVLKTVHRALEKRKLVNENASLREEINQASSLKTILGNSHTMGKMLDVAMQAASSKANVLIDGENGTGKGMLAEFIHHHSIACSGILVKINCTAIPESLLEAELFGYEPGAFTGANKRKKGRIELADQGTLFLDEIGIAPITFQTKLLRFLQEGEFEHLGGVETIKVATRVISATNSNLRSEIANGRFREDLFYRLNVVHIHVPPLRERKEDIPLLSAKFLEDSAKKNNRSVPLIQSQVMQALLNYRWPGNIRELQNLMERLVVLNLSGEITLNDLPVEISHFKKTESINIPLGVPLRQVEKIMMREALKTTQGDKRLAAKLIGVHPRTLYRFLESEMPSVEAVPAVEPVNLPIPEPSPEKSSI